MLCISPAPILKFTAYLALPLRGVGFLIRRTTAKQQFPQAQLGLCLWEVRALISEDISKGPQECLPSPVYQSSLSDTDALLPSERELCPEQCCLLQLPPFAFTPCQPNCSQNDSAWLTRVTVITVQGDRFPLCRKPWVKVQLTFKTHQHRQCYAGVKCKTNL